MNGRLRIALALPALAFALSCGDDETTAPVLEAPTDSTPPRIVSLSPDQGSIDASIHTEVRVRFSEPIRFNAATSSSLSLALEDAPLSGSVSRGDSASLVFTPHAVLDFATTYRASITTAVTDTALNPLEAARSWTFTTGGSAPPALSELAVMERIGALAHDSMAGRGSGTADELRAAEYIATEFEALGLEPGLPGYLQGFELPSRLVGGPVGPMSQNVLGVLPGEGALADEWVIVGAHYDHVGTRQTAPGTFEVFNGADDNASGTSLMLEAAQALAQHVEAGGTAGEARRSMLFIAFGAEELGLLGSDHYCANPTVPMRDVIAMVNFDMVGRLRNDELFVIGLWTSPAWDELLARYNADGLTLIDKQDCQSCSDYACFRRNERPAIWFFTGFHPQAHTPADDVELIDGAGAIEVGDLAMRTLIQLAVRSRSLTFGSVLP